MDYSLFGNSSFDPTTQPLIGLPPMGLYMSSAPPPGLESASQATGPAPAISDSQGWWGSITSEMSAGFSWVSGKAHAAADYVENIPGEIYGGTKNVIKHVYHDVEEGVETVVGDVAKPLTSGLSSTYWYIIGGVVVLAGALYFIGKGGALGQARG